MWLRARARGAEVGADGPRLWRRLAGRPLSLGLAQAELLLAGRRLLVVLRVPARHAATPLGSRLGLRLAQVQAVLARRHA